MAMNFITSARRIWSRRGFVMMLFCGHIPGIIQISEVTILKGEQRDFVKCGGPIASLRDLRRLNKA
jgi:hypothetical protein